MIESICTCVASDRWWKDRAPTKELDAFIASWNGDSIVKEARDLTAQSEYNESMTQVMLHSEIPFKGPACRNPTGCCGMCTSKCSYRCPYDLMLRAYLLYQRALETPEESRGAVERNIIRTVTNPQKTYNMLRYMVEDIISASANADTRKQARAYGTNPYKYDYGQRTVYEITSENRRIRTYDKNTGVVNYIHWPDSGLCPFSIPRITYRAKTGRK